MTRAPSWLNSGSLPDELPTRSESSVSPRFSGHSHQAHTPLGRVAARLADSLQASLSASNLSQSSLSRSDQSLSSHSFSSQSLGGLDSQAQALQYKSFENTFLRRPLKLASMGGRAHIQISILDLLNALGISKASLKGSNVDHWKTDQWQRDIDLLIPVSDCSQSKEALLAALAQCAPEERHSAFLLNERKVDQGGSTFYKVQLGHSIHGHHRVDLVFAEKMDFKFDVLQASSEIEFNTQRRSASLTRVERASVLNWLKQYGLLFFNPGILGGVGRLSIYCSKGVTQLLQPQLLQHFVEDAEPRELSDFVQRQFQSLEKMGGRQQQAFWLALAECLIIQVENHENESDGDHQTIQQASHLIESLLGWGRVKTPADLLSQLKQDPEFYKRLSTGKQCGCDIRDYMKVWLPASAENSPSTLRYLTSKLFMDVLGVRMVPPELLLSALSDLPLDIESNSPTLMHGILPALEHLKTSGLSGLEQESALQLERHLQELRHLPHKRCLDWLKHRPDLSVVENRMVLQQHLMACVEHISLPNESGSSNELLFKIILDIEKCAGLKKSNRNYSLIFDVFQNSSLDLILPDVNTIPDFDADPCLSLKDALLIFCKVGAVVQRMAVERFAGKPSGGSIGAVSDLLRKLFDANTELGSRFAFDKKKLIWFKSEEPSQNQLDWAWDHGSSRVVLVDKHALANQVINWSDGVESHGMSWNSDYRPDADHSISADGYPPMHLAANPHTLVWHCHAPWKVKDWQSVPVKAYIKIMLDHYQRLFGELSASTQMKLPEADLTLNTPYPDNMPNLRGPEFETSIVNHLSQAVFCLKIPDRDQQLTLILSGQQPLMLEVSPYRADPQRKMIISFTDPHNVMICHINSGLAGLDPHPSFYAPFNPALGQLQGLGYCEDSERGFRFSGLILGDQMIGPGVVRFSSFEHPFPLPNQLEGKVIPPDLLEIMGLILFDNADQIAAFHLNDIQMGEGRPLPDQFKGFVYFEQADYRMRGYVSNAVFVGEIALRETPVAGSPVWVVSMGRFLMSSDVESQADPRGMALSPMEFKPVRLPWGFALLSHGLLNARQCANLDQIKTSQALIYLGFKGWQLSVPRGQEVASRLNSLKFRLSPLENPLRLPLHDQRHAWESVRFSYSNSPEDDRVMFASQLAKDHIPETTLIVKGSGQWAHLHYRANNFYASNIVSAHGLAYKGMVRTSNEKWYPVPVGRIETDQQTFTFFQREYPVWDSLIQSSERTSAAMLEFDRVLRKANYPLRGMEVVNQLTDTMRSLLIPLLP